MSAWRARAIETFPELKSEIERVESVGLLWVDLQVRFDHAFESGDSETVRKIHRYAFWCADQPSLDVNQAIVCGLWWSMFQHWPKSKLITILKDVEKWVGKTELNRICGKYWQPMDEDVAREVGLESAKLLTKSPKRRNR